MCSLTGTIGMPDVCVTNGSAKGEWKGSINFAFFFAGI